MPKPNHPLVKIEITKHHMKPSCRGGSDDKKNLLRLKSDKHFSLHKLYGVLTWGEIVSYKCMELKGKKTPLHLRFDGDYWRILWGNKTLIEVVALMKRVRKLKNKRRKPCQS